MKRISILLAEDHTIVRAGLRALLEAEVDFKVVGEAETGRQAVELARALRPAVVVMDIAMPRLNGLEATRQILRAASGTRVLILSAHSDVAYVEQVIELGAAGFLVKQTSAHDLVTAVRAVQKGKTFFSPSIARSVCHRFDRTPGHGKLFRKESARLTAREREVLRLVAEGLANKQVATALSISIKTVEKHRQRLMEKLDIHDTAGLTRYAIAAGIIKSSVRVTILKP